MAAIGATFERYNRDKSPGSSDYEKNAVVETIDNDGLPPDPDAGLSEEERRANDRKLMRKLDIRLIPWLSLLYLISFLDRTNIGNAKLDGLLQGTHTNPNGQYNAALSIFFVSYAVFEPATNVLLKRFRPSIFLPATMIAWGIVMTCMGLVSSWSGLMACRWFLGLAEAGLFPGINYYLSCWYKREEFGRRAAIFFSAAAISGSFGGLLAAAIGQMRGVGGKEGWAWIFIIEGLATIVIATASFWMVHDFPHEAKFLSADDKARVLRRLALDKQASSKHEDLSRQHVKSAYSDWKTYLYALIYMGADMPLYAFSLFLPTIISELGYTSTRAQLLSVPPYAAACILTVIVGFQADRLKKRGVFNMATSLLGIVGFSMLLANKSPAVSYAGTFLGALGIYPCIANTISWTSNNIEGVYKRGIVLGTVIGWGNLCGVISSNIYRARDKPHYLPGHSSVLAFLIVFLFGGSTLMHLLLRTENKKRMQGRRDDRVEGKTAEEIDALGDLKPDFLYTL